MKLIEMYIKALFLQRQDISSGVMRHLRAGSSGEPSYNMRISQPKSDGEAYAKANAKLNELKKGGISGRCSLAGANIITGGSITFKNTIVLRLSLKVELVRLVVF